MAKDPAVLFYTSDFLSGTFTMTDEQVGKYMRLLCIQHQKGMLTEQDMLSICKAYDKHMGNENEDILGRYNIEYYSKKELVAFINCIPHTLIIHTYPLILVFLDHCRHFSYLVGIFYHLWLKVS